MPKFYLIIVPFGVLLLAGMVLSIRDYRDWKKIETQNFGQGPGYLFRSAEQMLEKVDLVGLGLRLRYPSEWKVVLSDSLQTADLQARRYTQRPEWSQVFRGKLNIELQIMSETEFTQPVNFGVRLQTSQKSSTDYVTSVVERLKKDKVMFVGDREYVTDGQLQWTIVTYVEENNKTKMAIAVDRNRVIEVTVNYEENLEKEFLRTFEGFLQEVKFVDF